MFCLSLRRRIEHNTAKGLEIYRSVTDRIEQLAETLGVRKAKEGEGEVRQRRPRALAEFVHSGAEERRDARDDVVGQGDGLGERLRQEAPVLHDVAADEAVRGASESLRPEQALLSPGPPPCPVQRPHRAGQEQHPSQSPQPLHRHRKPHGVLQQGGRREKAAASRWWI